MGGVVVVLMGTGLGALASNSSWRFARAAALVTGGLCQLGLAFLHNSACHAVLLFVYGFAHGGFVSNFAG